MYSDQFDGLGIPKPFNNAQHTAVSVDGEYADWVHSPAAVECHKWIDLFNSEFKLEIGRPALRVCKLRGACGYYRRDHNELGIKNEIAIDTEHFYAGCESREAWLDVLDTIAHECLHFWEVAERLKQGRKEPSGNYHTVVFRRKAESLGLLIDERGVSLGIVPGSPFIRLLEEHQVDVSHIEPPAQLPSRTTARTKLKLWQCCCSPPVKLRIGQSDPPPPYCTGCNTLYVLQSPSG
ncbi:MAG: hypothetical protein Aurels2KO_53990 [Aureliella sp.]